MRVDALLVAVPLLAAAGWIFSREVLLGGLPPLWFIGTRFLLAAPIVHLSCGGGFRLGLDGTQLRAASLAGCASAAVVMIWVIALSHTHHLGVGAFINSLAVVMVPPLAAWWYGVRIVRRHALAMALALAGLFTLALDGQAPMEWSHLLFFAAAVAYAGHFTFASRLAGRMPAAPLTTVQLFIVGAVSLLASALTENWPSLTSPGFDVWAWVLASILLATALRFYLQTQAQRTAGAGQASLFLSLEPVFASAMAALAFGERMSFVQLIGAALIFLSLPIARAPQPTALRRDPI